MEIRMQTWFLKIQMKQGVQFLNSLAFELSQMV